MSIYKPENMPVIIMEIALVCLEAAISMLRGHAGLSMVAHDLDEIIADEKQHVHINSED